MKSKMKKLLTGTLVAAMCFTTAVQAADVPKEKNDVADRAVSFYEGADSEFVKISHPEKPASTKTTNTTDGLIDYLGNNKTGVTGVDEGANGQGDRGQSYSWAAATYGDWMYVATQYNPSMSTITLMDSGLGHSYDPEVIEALFNAMYRGEFFVSEEDGGNPGSVLSKINVKTGEVAILMSKDRTGTNVNFRNALRYGNKLYFCGGVNGIPSVYEIDPETDDIQCVFQDESMKVPDAWPQALKKQLSPTIRGMAVYEDYLVINCVGLDENPYIAISNNPSEGFKKIAFAWEDVENKVPGELLGYPACHFQDSIYGGSIWEIIPFNGDLYVAMCTGTPDNSADGGKTMQSFAIIRGECDGDPELRESWTWTPVIGDKEDGARYTFGIDPERTRSGACNMMVFNDHLYIGEYNDTEIALVKLMFGVDARFLADNLDQSVNLYRMDKDENIELVVGDPTEMFPEGSISGLGSGFDKCENQYIWKMDTFQDKLYVGTFDESSILYPVGQVSNGDIFKLTPEQWRRQLKYIKELILTLIEKAEKPEEQVQVFAEEGLETEEVDMDAIKELSRAFDTAEAVSVLDLPAAMSADGGYKVQSLEQFQKGMIMLEGMLEQQENWSDEQKLQAKVAFSEFYEGLYDYYSSEEAQMKLPGFIKGIYDKILNNEMFGKISGLARCVIALRNNVRGFDMMVSEDGVNFDVISRDGLGDNHNQGLRAFGISRDEKNPWMCIGTANPFYGTQIWRLQDESLVFPGEDSENAVPGEPEVKPDGSDPDGSDPENGNPENGNPEIKDSQTIPENQDTQNVSATVKPADKKSSSPLTGDTAAIIPIAAVLLISGAAVIVLIKRKKRS